LRPSKSWQAKVEGLNVVALKQLRGDLIRNAETAVRQANVKPGCRAAVQAHQLRVGTA
jgi:hypothetical protein